jgi:hypothetical protein
MATSTRRIEVGLGSGGGKREIEIVLVEEERRDGGRRGYKGEWPAGLGCP